MRLRTFSLLGPGLAALLILAGCGGDDEPSPSPTPAPIESTPAPTATPLARVPDPVVVTGNGAPGRGGGESVVEYVVEPGDTLGAIAARFGVEPDVIREANGLDGDNILAGQTLRIPRAGAGSGTGGTPSTPSGGSPGATATPPATAADGEYVVQEGDTAFGIALQFDVTLEALAAANGMTEDEITDLQIGQVLIIPSPE